MARRLSRGEVWLYTFKSPDKRRLERYFGNLSPEKMKAVCRALNVATGCGV